MVKLLDRKSRYQECEFQSQVYIDPSLQKKTFDGVSKDKRLHVRTLGMSMDFFPAFDLNLSETFTSCFNALQTAGKYGLGVGVAEA